MFQLPKVFLASNLPDFNAVSRFETSSAGSGGSILTTMDVIDRLADTCHIYVPVTWQTSRAAPLASLFLLCYLYSSPRKHRIPFSESFSFAILPPTKNPPTITTIQTTCLHHTLNHIFFKRSWDTSTHIDLHGRYEEKWTGRFQKVKASSTISCKWAAQRADKDPAGQEVAGA